MSGQIAVGGVRTVSERSECDSKISKEGVGVGARGRIALFSRACWRIRRYTDIAWTSDFEMFLDTYE